MVSRREVIQEGRKVVIETPVFPGYTPEVTTRYLYEDGTKRRRYVTRAKQTAAKANPGPSQVALTTHRKHPRDPDSGGSTEGSPEMAAQPLSRRMKKLLNKRKRAEQAAQDHDAP